VKEIKSYIIDTLEKENRHIKKTMSKNRDALKKPHPTYFVVNIISLWANEGEINVSIKKDTLEKAFQAAVEKFKELNKRRDIQADFHVYAYLYNGVELKLPNKYWDKLEKEERLREKEEREQKQNSTKE
jgi:hypothetical protein